MSQLIAASMNAAAMQACSTTEIITLGLNNFVPGRFTLSSG